MRSSQRDQVIEALKAASASLIKPGGPRKRRNKKPRETPDFKTTDEMLKYAMRHKGERDVPAPGIKYRGTTSDSEIPDTFGRVWASLLSGKDIGRKDVKKFYVAMPFDDEPYAKDKVKDLAHGVLDGVQGISDTSEIIMQWYGMARDAVLVMDADKLAKANKLSRVQYDNPEYLVSNGMAALHRVFDKKRDKSGQRGIAGNLIDHMMVGTKLSKNRGGEVLAEAKSLADQIEKDAAAVRAALKALPFDKDDLRSAVRSVTDNQMDEDDVESFLQYRADEAVKSLRSIASYYDGLTEKALLYFGGTEMALNSDQQQAVAMAPKAEANALDYGWDADQTTALVKLMQALVTVVKDFDEISKLETKAKAEIENMKGDSAMFYALDRGMRTILEQDFADHGTDDIKTVKGLAKRMHDVFSKSGHWESKDIPLASYERALRKALKSIGKTYSTEGEWLVKDKKLKVPAGSVLFVTNSGLPSDVDERRKSGTLTKNDSFIHGAEIQRADKLDRLIKENNLESRYKVHRIDPAKFAKARSLWIEKPRKPVAASLKLALKAVASAQALIQADVREWAAKVAEDLGLGAFEVYEQHGNGMWKLQMLAVPKGSRKQGLGSQAMERLIDHADEQGKTIILSPALPDDKWGTTSRARLVQFYKGFGFVENKGRDKDFTISEGMYRLPKIKARRPVTSNAKLVLASYEIHTDETGKFWGSQGAGGVFLAEDTGRILIQKRSPHVNEPGTYGTWGGKIDDGEDPKQAMEREIEEESGYRGPKQVKLVYTFQDGKFKFYNFVITVPHEFEPKHSWETSDHIWTTLDDLPSPLHFGFKAFLPHLKSALGRKVAAKSFSDVDIPRDFRLMFFMPNEKVPTLGAQLAHRQLEGVTGITDSGQVLMLRMLGANRNAMLVMPGPQTAKLNKLSRIMYENPEYWMSKDMAALIRVYGGSTDHQAAINRIFQAAEKSPGSKDFMRKVANLEVFYSHFPSTPVNSVRDLAKQWFTLAKAKVMAKMKGDGVSETDPDPSKWADSWAKDRYADLLSPKAYVKAITDGLMVIAKTFVWEGEWLLKDKTLRIPQGSRLFITKPKGRSDQPRLEAQQAMIAEHGLDKVYKIAWVDGEKLQQIAMKHGMQAADKLVKQRLPAAASVRAASQDWVIETAFDGQRSSTIEAVQRTDQRKLVIGSLELSWTAQAAVVTDIRVRGQVAGKGVGTSLYESAAKLAETRGLPLRSDTSRYPGADGFWKKQVSKGRATAVPIGPNKVAVDPDKIRYYQLNYPPPTSLG